MASEFMYASFLIVLIIYLFGRRRHVNSEFFSVDEDLDLLEQNIENLFNEVGSLKHDLDELKAKPKKKPVIKAKAKAKGKK